MSFPIICVIYDKLSLKRFMMGVSLKSEENILNRSDMDHVQKGGIGYFSLFITKQEYTQSVMFQKQIPVFWSLMLFAALFLHFSIKEQR